MKKWMRFLVAIALVATVGALVGCSSPEPEMSPEETVSKALETYKAGDLDGFATYFSGTYEGELSDEALSENFGLDPATTAAFMDAWAASTDYTVKSEKIDGETATVEVEVTTVDFTKLLASEQEKLMADVEKNPEKYASMSQDEMISLVFETISASLPSAEKGAPQTVTTELILDTSGDAPVWKINDESLVTALFPES